MGEQSSPLALWKAATLRLKLYDDSRTAEVFGVRGKTLAHMSSVADVRITISAHQYIKQRNGTYAGYGQFQDDGTMVPVYSLINDNAGVISRCDANGSLTYDDNFLGYTAFTAPDAALPQNVILTVKVEFADINQARATLASRTQEDKENDEERVARGEVLGRQGSGEAYALPKNIGECEIQVALPARGNRETLPRGTLLNGDRFNTMVRKCTLQHYPGSHSVGEFSFRFSFIQRPDKRVTECELGHIMCETFVDNTDEYKRVFFQAASVNVNADFDIEDEASGMNLYPRYNLKPEYTEYKEKRQLLYSRLAVPDDEEMNLFVRFTGAVKFKFSTLPTFIPAAIRDALNLKVSGSVQARAQFNFGTKLTTVNDANIVGQANRRIQFEDYGWVLHAAFNIAFTIPLGGLFSASLSATRIGNVEAIRIYTLRLSCRVPAGDPGEEALRHMAHHLSVTLVPVVLDAMRIYYTAQDAGDESTRGRDVITKLALAAKAQFLEAALMLGWTLTALSAALADIMSSSVSLVINVLSSKLKDTDQQAMDVSIVLAMDISVGGIPPGFPIGMKVSHKRMWDLSNMALVSDSVCPAISPARLEALKAANNIKEEEDDAEDADEEGDPAPDE